MNLRTLKKRTALLLLPLLFLSGCLGSGYRESRSEAWVLPSRSALVNLSYAVLPIQFAEEAIPADLYEPWRTQRRLSLTVHLRRDLEEAFRHAGFLLTDRELLSVAFANVSPAPAAWTPKERHELADRLDAEAVIAVTMLQAGPTRLKAVIEATRIADGELIWRCERTDMYGSETPNQGKRLVKGMISRLRVAGLPLRR